MRRTGAAHYVGRTVAVNECSEPDFEIDQQPETIRVPSPSTTVLVYELLQRRAIEVPSRHGSRAEHELVNERAELATEPVVDRYGKPHLGAVHHFGRNKVLDCGA